MTPHLQKIATFNFWLLMMPVLLFSQTDQASFLHVSAENDFFVVKGDATDRYYTNGVRIDYYFKNKKRRFPSNLLLKVGDDKNIYSLGIAQYMFTPTEIDVPTIRYGDHPYAGALFGIYALDSYLFENRMKVKSELYFGVIGPLSLAKESQIFTHKLFDQTRPEGWDHQIPNDILINYNLRLEKEMIHVPGKLFVTGHLETFVGSLYDAMGAGFSLRMGRIKNFLKFSDDSSAKSDQNPAIVYVIFKPTIRVVYYNALLQGGIITKQRKSYNGYTLDKDEIERINVFTEIGIVYERPKMQISFKQKMRTEAFENGHAMEYGNIAFGIKL